MDLCLVLIVWKHTKCSWQRQQLARHLECQVSDFHSLQQTLIAFLFVIRFAQLNVRPETPHFQIDRFASLRMNPNRFLFDFALFKQLHRLFQIHFIWWHAVWNRSLSFVLFNVRTILADAHKHVTAIVAFGRRAEQKSCGDFWIDLFQFVFQT